MRFLKSFIHTSKNGGVSSLPSKLLNNGRSLSIKAEAADTLFGAYKDHINPEKLVCLNQLKRQWVAEKPLLGKKILFNQHLTLITLAEIEPLVLAGADVTVTATPSLAVHDNALSAIKKSGITYYPGGSIPEEKLEDFFDCAVDCGGDLAKKVKTKNGHVELTKTDKALYTDVPFPVISVDDSKTKAIETGFGTGDALVRVLTDGAKKSIWMMMNAFASNQDFLQMPDSHHLMSIMGLMDIAALFEKQKFTIFGGGKVGLGITAALVSAGAKKENIFIIDTCSEAYMGFREQGYQGSRLDTSSSASLRVSRQKIQKHLAASYACITATGIENAISNYFEPVDFKNVSLLINMGTPDEWGHKFSRKDILNGGKPANFLLEYPTEVIYLDPIFYLLLKSIELLIQKKFKPGLHKVPEALDKQVVSDWMAEHGEQVYQYDGEQGVVKDFINYVRTKPRESLSDDYLGHISRHYGIFSNHTTPKTSLVCFTPEKHDTQPKEKVKYATAGPG